MVWLGISVWTIFVAVGFWWLLRGDAGSMVWIVRKVDSAQKGAPEEFHSISKTEIGLQRVYPWILLGPYVALVGWLFPLERGRFRLALPMNLAVCAAFVAGCQAINAHTRVTFTGALFLRPDPMRGETNAIHVRISSTGKFRPENVMKNAASRKAPDSPLSNHPAGVDGGSTNVFEVHSANPPFSARQGFQLPPIPPAEPQLSLWSMLVDFLAYGAMAGLTHSVHFYRRFRERERRALLLESSLSKARLDTLQAQLHPHFLFNSLNAIAALLRRDPRLAEATLTSLSELLRLALSQSERQEIFLREEMQFVQRYLEIQQTRFADKLRVEQAIEPAALDCLVPSLVLQPLIENAIRHGIEPLEKAGMVRVTAQRGNGELILTVEDDGMGLTGDRARAGNGIGLANLRARLETLYGTGQSLELIPRSGAGTVVRVHIPWRLPPATAEERAPHSARASHS